jgi:hypothetical protein
MKTGFNADARHDNRQVTLNAIVFQPLTQNWTVTGAESKVFSPLGCLPARS